MTGSGRRQLASHLRSFSNAAAAVCTADCSCGGAGDCDTVLFAGGCAPAAGEGGAESSDPARPAVLPGSGLATVPRRSAAAPACSLGSKAAAKTSVAAPPPVASAAAVVVAVAESAAAPSSPLFHMGGGVDAAEAAARAEICATYPTACQCTPLDPQVGAG